MLAKYAALLPGEETLGHLFGESKESTSKLSTLITVSTVSFILSQGHLGLF